MSDDLSNITKAVEITLAVLEKTSDFNVNDFSTYSGKDEYACKVFNMALKELTGDEASTIRGLFHRKEKHALCKYKGYWISLTCGQFNNPPYKIQGQWISRLKPLWFREI